MSNAFESIGLVLAYFPGQPIPSLPTLASFRTSSISLGSLLGERTFCKRKVFHGNLIGLESTRKPDEIGFDGLRPPFASS